MKLISPKEQTQRFSQSVAMKNIIITENILNELEKLFTMIPLKKISGSGRGRIGSLFSRGFNDVADRYMKLKNTNRGSKENLILLYGKKLGGELYKQRAEAKKFTNPLSRLSTVERFSIKAMKYLKRPITELEKIELKKLFDDFDKLNIKENDWNLTIFNFMKFELNGYYGRIQKLKNIHSGKLESFILRYGEEFGNKKYLKTNLKKKKGLDNSLVAQKRRAKIAGDKLRNTTEYTCRHKDFWIKKGMTDKEAKKQVAEIQRRGKDFWIEKYGEEKGVEFWQKRNKKWLETMKNKTDLEKMRIRRERAVKSGKASKESLLLFDPLSKFVSSFNMKFYLGVENNIEYFIKKSKGFCLYDFTIPKLKLIIEYHGETWHPNPTWSKKQLTEWRNPITGITSDIQLQNDISKKKLAEERGFTVIEIYSSEDKLDALNKCEKEIINLLDSSK